MAIGIRNIRPGNFLDFAGDAAINTVLNKWGGDSLGVATVKGVADATLWAMLGPKAGWMFTLGQIGVVGTTAAYNAARKNWGIKQDNYYTSGQIGGQYQDSIPALTMRQAAVNAIKESRINGRIVLGNEASYLHR